jgi:tetrahydromethanopterin S-methyltransferase subunit H
MFKFENKQSVFQIGKTPIGGQPGRKKTMLIGSLFYPGHSIVEDRIEGKVNRPALEEKMNGFWEAKKDTECLPALMIYADTVKAMSSYLGLVADNDLPIFLDSSTSEVKIEGAKRAMEMGIADRIVYNTLNVGSPVEEWEQVGQTGVKSAVIMAFNPRDISVKGKIYMLENGGGILDEGLLDLAGKYGIEKPLVDVAAMSVEQGAGAALRALFVAKAKWGLPTGCALHNAVESWDVLTSVRATDPKIFRYVDIASAVLPIMSGADFVMYGPIEYAKTVFYAAAFADQLMSQAAADI